MTTRSTPASSIIGTSRSMVKGSGNCGLRPGTHCQSGDSAFHRWTCASTIRRWAPCPPAPRGPCAASTAPAPRPLATKLRRLGMGRSSLGLLRGVQRRHLVQPIVRRSQPGHNGIDGGPAARHGFWLHSLAVAIALALAPQLASADEVGESFWTPGSFGSLAATASQPGFSLTSTYYHTSTSAGIDVARARLIRIGRLTGEVGENVSAISIQPEDLAMVTPTYTFATPVLGGQAALAVQATYGRKRTTDDAVISTQSLLGPFTDS